MKKLISRRLSIRTKDSSNSPIASIEIPTETTPQATPATVMSFADAENIRLRRFCGGTGPNYFATPQRRRS